MIMPVMIALADVEIGRLYMVAATDGCVGVSFQDRLADVEKPNGDQQWVLHFESYITLRVVDDSKISLFEVLEGI